MEMLKAQLYIFVVGAGAVIHTHSSKAVLATMLYTGREFKIQYQEMIKGIRKDTDGK